MGESQGTGIRLFITIEHGNLVSGGSKVCRDIRGHAGLTRPTFFVIDSNDSHRTHTLFLPLAFYDNPSALLYGIWLRETRIFSTPADNRYLLTENHFPLLVKYLMPKGKELLRRFPHVG